LWAPAEGDQTRSTIEDDTAAQLKADFANCCLGGGVLGTGCVQEEIMFVVYPELLVGMLMFDTMQADEAIEIIGAERFAQYAGYARSFRFTGDYVDTTPRDAMGTLKLTPLARSSLWLRLGSRVAVSSVALPSAYVLSNSLFPTHLF
jgi:hypothetical protein